MIVTMVPNKRPYFLIQGFNVSVHFPPEIDPRQYANRIQFHVELGPESSVFRVGRGARLEQHVVRGFEKM